MHTQQQIHLARETLLIFPGHLRQHSMSSWQVRIWHGSLLAPARARRFFGASVADNAVLRIEAMQKHSRTPLCYTERLLQTPCFSDVRVVCVDGSVLEAHKALLPASSPVFNRMFESGMLETKENSVSIPAPKEVVASLQHVYTGVFDPNIDAAMIELAHTCKIWQFAGKWWTTWPPQMFVPRRSVTKQPARLGYSYSSYMASVGSAQMPSDVFEQI